MLLSVWICHGRQWRTSQSLRRQHSGPSAVTDELGLTDSGGEHHRVPALTDASPEAHDYAFAGPNAAHYDWFGWYHAAHYHHIRSQVGD